MLVLSNQTPFANGCFRNCFIHPHDPTLCVKVLRSSPQAKRRKKHWIKSWFRSDGYYNLNLREFAEYRRLARIGDEIIWRHIPHHHGFVDTDLGQAAVMQLVCNADGSIAHTLEKEILSGNIPHEALGEFYSFLDLGYLHNFRDATPSNVVCARLENGNSRLLVIDGVNGFLPFRGKKHAMKYAERFRSRVSRLIKPQHG